MPYWGVFIQCMIMKIQNVCTNVSAIHLDSILEKIVENEFYVISRKMWGNFLCLCPFPKMPPKPVGHIRPIQVRASIYLHGCMSHVLACIIMFMLLHDEYPYIHMLSCHVFTWLWSPFYMISLIVMHSLAMHVYTWHLQFLTELLNFHFLSIIEPLG